VTRTGAHGVTAARGQGRSGHSARRTDAGPGKRAGVPVVHRLPPPRPGQRGAHAPAHHPGKRESTPPSSASDAPTANTSSGPLAPLTPAPDPLAKRVASNERTLERFPLGPTGSGRRARGGRRRPAPFRRSIAHRGLAGRAGGLHGRRSFPPREGRRPGACALSPRGAGRADPQAGVGAWERRAATSQGRTLTSPGANSRDQATVSLARRRPSWRPAARGTGTGARRLWDGRRPLAHAGALRARGVTSASAGPLRSAAVTGRVRAAARPEGRPTASRWARSERRSEQARRSGGLRGRSRTPLRTQR
jgi:hypothetical protein